MADFEVTVIGAGVVGLAVGAHLAEKHPHLVVLEKNRNYGMETSSRNSEVIHGGIAYRPDSLKARLCVEGRDELYTLCRSHNIGHRRITKLISAADDSELEKLELLFQNGSQNGVELRLLSQAEVKRLEPNIRSCGALYSPATGIVSAHELMDYFARALQDRGGILHLRCKVVCIAKRDRDYEIVIEEPGRTSDFTSEVVVNAAGLNADEVARSAGMDIDAAGYRLTYCKGSYFSVKASKSRLVSRLIYPVPRNETLGVHAVIDLEGKLKFGPDAEFLPDRTIDYSVAENKRRDFAASVKHLVPAIDENDIEPDMSGIRPKLQRNGDPPRDFVIAQERERGLEGFVNLIGIDSPGLTSSPAIARYVDHLLYSSQAIGTRDPLC